MPRYVDETITDSVTQEATTVLGDIPASAMGNLMLVSSHALATGTQNLSMAQQQANVMWQMVTVQGVNALLNTGNAVTGVVSGQLIDLG